MKLRQKLIIVLVVALAVAFSVPSVAVASTTKQDATTASPVAAAPVAAESGGSTQAATAAGPLVTSVGASPTKVTIHVDNPIQMAKCTEVFPISGKVSSNNKPILITLMWLYNGKLYNVGGEPHITTAGSFHYNVWVNDIGTDHPYSRWYTFYVCHVATSTTTWARSNAAEVLVSKLHTAFFFTATKVAKNKIVASGELYYNDPTDKWHALAGQTVYVVVQTPGGATVSLPCTTKWNGGFSTSYTTGITGLFKLHGTFKSTSRYYMSWSSDHYTRLP